MVKGKDFVIYSGSAFTLEWYFNPKGKSQAQEYYQGLHDSDRRKALFLFKRMGDVGKIMDETKFRSEGDKVFAFKPQPHRFLSFFVVGHRIIVTNAFHKKSDKLPVEEKGCVLEAMADYSKRTEGGSYYENDL
jgi:phage-related protein